MINNFSNMKCDNCSEELGSERYICESCNETVCKNCAVECEICGEIVCKKCSIECEHCARKVCENCLENTDDNNICKYCFDDKFILVDSDCTEEDDFESIYV